MTVPGYNQGGNNISGQFGMPLYGIAGPHPPFRGNYFWVDGTNGSDGNTGGPQDPFKTLTQALAACTAGNDDVIFFSGTFSPTATLAWNKNRTHLIGLTYSPYGTPLISVASVAATSGAISPLVNVTATGCLFKNFSVLSGINQAATQVAWAEAGGQNTYINVNINQVGHATAAAQAGNRALTLASLNNYFEGCILGGDAIIRATGTNISVEALDGAGSTLFRKCVLPMYTSVAANTFFKTSSTALSGYFIFDDCMFMNDINTTSGTALTVAITVATASLSTVLLTPGTITAGCTDVAAAGATYVSTPAISSTGGNLGLAAT